MLVIHCNFSNRFIVHNVLFDGTTSDIIRLFGYVLKKLEKISMSKTFKVGGTVTIYFGDSMRSFLKKSLRKKNTFFVDHIIIAIDGDILTVFPNSRTDDKEVPYEVSGLRIDKSDRHILAEGELMYLSELNKSELMVFAEEHKYNPKEFKEAMKPFRKAHKKDD